MKTPVLLGLSLFGLNALAQLAPPNPEGVAMGHLHLNARDPEAQKRFWIEGLGAKPAKLGNLDIYELPGVIIFVNKAASPAQTEGSVIDHIGMKVRDLQGTAAKAEAAQAKVLTRNDTQIMLLGPDGLKVEMTADAALPQPVVNHHIHFFTPDVPATQKWYASTFGAIPGKRARFDAADLPGVNLTFSKSDTALPGTKGRVLDHIGFEVKDLEAFTKKLEAGGVKFSVPYRKLPNLGIAIAFFTDPWGTYIELTEGLTQVQ